MKQFLILVFLLATMKATAQNMAINNDGSAAHAKAILELKSTDKGLIIPRMTQAQRTAMFTVPDITAKATLVYQTDGTEGYYYYDGANWKNLQVSGTSNGWDLLGNSGTTPTTNFLGTTDNTGLSVKTNNTERIRISETGLIGIGKSAPTVTLDLVSPNLIPMRIKSENNNGYSGLQFVSNTPAVTGHIGYANAAATNFPNSVYSGSIASIPYVLTTADQERMRITESGAIGVGTTAPASKMEILANSSTGYQHLRLTESENDFSRLGYYTSGKTDFWETTAMSGTDNTQSYYNIFRSNAGNLLTVRADGNVGISNGNPTFPLTFSNSLGSKISFWTGSTANFGIGVQLKLLQLYTAAQADDIAFGYGSSGSFNETMRIMGAGNVGIGTSTPNNKLHVMGNINISADNNYRINNVQILANKGNANIFVGENAGAGNTTGYSNSFLGYMTGYSNADGNWNTFQGTYTGYDNTNGHRNTFIGAVAGRYNTSGAWNTFIGTDAGQRNTTGNNNTALGFQGGYSTTTGNNNVFIGKDAGFSNTTGSNNTAVGFNAQTGSNLTNATAIGNNASVTTSNSLVLGGTGANAVNVGIGTTAPAAELHVNGFTKLGDDAPAIKTKKLTGTLSATQGINNLFPHGLTSTKILSVSVLVEYSSGNYVPANYTVSAGYEFNYVITSTNVIVVPVSGNSGTIVSKAVKILITYEE